MKKILILFVLLLMSMEVVTMARINRPVNRPNQPVEYVGGNQTPRVLKPTRPTSGGYGGFQTPTTGTNKPPAWLGNNPLSGANAGGGSGQNNSTAWNAITSAIGAANTGGGGSGGNGWISMDQPSGQPTPQNQPAFMTPPIPRPPVGFQTPAYSTPMLPSGTRGDPTGQIAAQFNDRPAVPRWLNALTSYIASANTGGGNGWISMDQPSGQPSGQPYQPSPTNQNAGPVHVAGNVHTVNGQVPQAEGYTQPENIQLGSGDANNSMSDTLRSIMAGNYTPATLPWATPPRPGFGTSYGGNWQNRPRGNGGGGGGGGGGGYSDTPAWLNQYLNLNSWNI